MTNRYINSYFRRLALLVTAACLLAACTNYEARVPFTTGVKPTATSQPASLDTGFPVQSTLPPVQPPIGPTSGQPTADPVGVQVIPAATLTSPPGSQLEPIASPEVRFAIIGDYGLAGQPEEDVASLVLSWNPDFIVTTGDNNYPDGESQTIDQNIGQYYHSYIFPYNGEFGAGADQSRFFPTLGNHDWNTSGAQPYLDYFELPGNERYYDFTWGPVHIFAIDSDSREPDGVSRRSAQAQWLKDSLAASQSPWKLVVMHHPPFSSGLHGAVDWMNWPFKEWGASAVIAGHDHTYERIVLDDLLYLVNGLGGGPIYRFENITDGSQVRYNNDYGALLVTTDASQITFQFFNRGGELIDQYQMLARQP